MTPLLLAAAAVAAEPTWFEYRFERTVGDGVGTYAGYSDATSSTGRYELTTVGDTVDVGAHYEWHYQSTSEPSDEGTTDRTTRYDRRSWRYSAPIDLDDAEWAQVEPSTLGPWFAIDPRVAVGDTAHLLDLDCRVTRLDAPVQAPDGPHAAIECVSEGTGRRADSYGEMATHFTETTRFDRTTGLVLEQVREETDEGTLNGEWGKFVMRENLRLTDASYAPKPPPTAADLAFGLALTAFGIAATLCPALLPFALLGGGGYLIWRSTRPPRTVQAGGFGTVALRPPTSAVELARWTRPTATQRYAPFLEDFARRALQNGDVAVLATSGEDLVGFAVGDREAEIATVFTPDATIAGALLRWVGTSEFFSDVRHQRGNSNAYNVYETFRIMRLAPLPEVRYDASLVTPATAADAPAIAACLAAVAPGVKFDKWLATAFASGDLVFVARVDGAVVGVGFAVVCGSSARLSYLGVVPAHRDKGIGKELLRARLAALREIGVEEVISEISEVAPASLHLAREHGFVEFGQMFVETTAPQRYARTIVRR